jgi:hypothetical protein
MATRAEVYHAIDTERDYQDALWNQDIALGKGAHSIEEWIVYLEDYLGEAKHFLSRMPAATARMHTMPLIRKVAAMAVCCMEQHGAPVRDMEDLRRLQELAEKDTPDA